MSTRSLALRTEVEELRALKGRNVAKAKRKWKRAIRRAERLGRKAKG